VSDPRAGAELVAAFYESDVAAFHADDDSDGVIGDVCRLDACVNHARQPIRNARLARPECDNTTSRSCAIELKRH